MHGVASHVDVFRASSRVPSFLLWGRGRNALRIPKNVCVVGYAWREVKFKTRFYVGRFQHLLQPLLLTSKCLLLTIIQGATFSYREGVKHRLCRPYWGMYAITYLVALWIIMFKGNIEGFFIYHKPVKITRFQLM